VTGHDQPAATVDLPVGSVVIERYQPDKGRAQWLAMVVNGKGELQLRAVCKTRHEALVEADRHGR
jgi:hypothetical protein